MSRETIRKIYNAADKKKIIWSMIKDSNEADIKKLLFEKEKGGVNLTIKQPNFDYIHKELLKPGTNLKLLWEEYANDCRNVKIPYYQYSYFCEKYREHVQKNNLTMHIKHKPGDKMMVDWNGTTMKVIDQYTGEVITAYLFEASLPFSMMTYAQACPNMTISSWIECNTNAFSYFGGVTRILVPDNLKTAIIKNKKYDDPIMNKSFQDMADYYDIAIIPARVKRPKDKAAVESSVGSSTPAIVGKLRNREFFSFEELNRTILGELDIYNSKPFQKREGSRKSVYLEEELPFMKDFPSKPYELTTRKQEIINSFIKLPIINRKANNALIENCNKAIKLIKHSSNGYTCWSRFRNRVLYSLNDDVPVKF